MILCLQLIHLLGVVEGKMGEVLGELHCTLDGRFSSVRTAETNLGNLVTDIMVAALNADCALLNSGTLRSDTLHPEGKFILRVNILLTTLDTLAMLTTKNCYLRKNNNILNFRIS